MVDVVPGAKRLPRPKIDTTAGIEDTDWLLSTVTQNLLSRICYRIGNVWFEIVVDPCHRGVALAVKERHQLTAIL